MKKILKFKKQSLYFLIAILIVVGVYSVGYCKMVQMTDNELNKITAGGFSKVELINDGVYDLARMQFNVEVETFANIDSLKMGYWDNGAGIGWDQNWMNVQMGTSINDLKMKGYIFEVKFSNIDDPANRELEEVRFGFLDVVGTVAADFQSLSKLGANPRQVEGIKTYTFNHDPLIITIKCRGQDAGIWFDFGNAKAN